MKSKIILAIVILLLVAGVVIYSKAVKPIPPDNAQLTELKFDGLMGSRYTEILLVFGNGLTKNFTAGVYNTVGLNGADPNGNRDSSPADLSTIDIEKARDENKALSVVKNGPRRWTVDNIGVKAGKIRDFHILKAHWVMWFPIPPVYLEGETAPYTVMHANRDTSMSINEGSRVYLLDDPDGNSWCMKSMGLINDPNQKFEELKNLGSRLKLAEGWKFRTKILEQDLVFMTDNGKTMITQDDIGNTYDRIGGPYSNYKP